ncbi:helitron_like_N domain-containing protein [Trichonephila clavipes]|nr:helitron_like_N domain-containing protein [Trichonephila clavipes]
MINPQTGEGTNKKVSSMNYYLYRLMIRQNAENHILKCRQLFHQYIVDMYAKIETERLLYIRLNQTELRSEQYIHLRDAIVNDGNVNQTNWEEWPYYRLHSRGVHGTCMNTHKMR